MPDKEDVFRDDLDAAIAVALDNELSYDTIISEMELKVMALREEAENEGDE
jgi:hypothetical protein